MTTEELAQIAKLLEPLKQGQERLEQGQTRLEKGHLQHATALETLAEGVQDMREHMATKDGVDIAVETAKIELKADNFTYFAPIARKVKSHERRIEELEKEKGVDPAASSLGGGALALLAQSLSTPPGALGKAATNL